MPALTVSDFFGPGTLVQDRDYGSLVTLVRGHLVGELHVSSRHVVVGDPYGIEHVPPLGLRVRRGRYPVYAGTSEMDAGVEGTGLLLRLADAAVRRWRSLRSTTVDGATIAIGDAGDAERLGAADAMTAWHAALAAAGTFGVVRGPRRTKFFVCHIQSDGSYPVRAGFDERERLVAIVAAGHDPRRYRRWPPATAKLPTLDIADLEACLSWARAVGAEDPVVEAGHVDRATLLDLERYAGRRAPRALRRYYATHTPWADGVDLATFHAAAAAHGLAPGEGVFPVRVDGPESLVALRRRKDGRDEVVSLYRGSQQGTALDLAAWAVLSTIAVHDLASR